jgi:2-desacetyl-2-hydroxyethyl bacteriochlorophyllide A dehydrogenase
MRAAVLTKLPSRYLELQDIPEREPRAGELLLEVAATGICGTDLHILEGSSYHPELPFVLGHEPVGRVIGTGSAADDEWLGRRVTITLFSGEGECAQCRAGDERLCASLRSITGVWRAAGGFATRLVVRTAQAMVLPDAVSDEVAASLVDAGATAANSVRVAAALPHRLAVVVGGGPVGFFAAELLRVAGSRVVVVQPSRGRREALEAIGHRVVASIEEVTEPPGCVIDAAGAPQVLPWALSALAPQGTYVAAGYGPVDHLDLAPAARKELIVRGVRSGRRDDLAGLIEFVANGRVHLPPISRWPLAAINEALDALRARQVPGKAVIDVRS